MDAETRARRWRRLAIAGWALAIVALAATFGVARVLRTAYVDAKLAATISPRPGPSWDAGARGSAPRGARVVLVLGDSRVRRWAPTPSAPGVLFVLRGVGGETSRALRARVADEVAVADPDVVLLAIGINDLVAASLAPATRQRVLDALLENVEASARAARAAGAARVGLLTIVRPARPGLARRWLLGTDHLPALVGEANERLRALARASGLELIDLDAAMGGENEYLPAARSVDALHFSAEGYATWNAVLERELE